MRLLLYTQNHEPGGGNRYFTDFINAVPQSNAVDIVCNERGLFHDDITRIKRPCNLTELNVSYKYKRISKKCRLIRLLFIGITILPIIRTLYVKSLSAKNKKLFKKHLSQKQYDVVIAFNGGYPGAYSCFDILHVASESECKTYMSVVSMPVPKSYIDKIYIPSTEKIDGFIVNCGAIKQQLFSTRGIALHKIYTLYNCVNIPLQCNNYNNMPSRLLRFGFVGRVEYLKGAELLINAFSEALKSHSNITLTLYGKVMLSPHFVDIVNKSSNRIILNGPFNSSEMDVYPHVDVLILPSFWEGFPYVIIEAMAYGIPVIATNVGGISEVVRTGETGTLIEPRNKEKLVQAILDISNSTEDLFRLGANALQEVRTRFAWDIFKNNVEIYMKNIYYIRS